MTQFDPRDLRSAFGRFMTGVTVVTARAPDGTSVGFTANSFTSVSMDPPLLLVCPGKFLSSYQTFAECTDFAISILAEGQEGGRDHVRQLQRRSLCQSAPPEQRGRTAAD